MTSGAEMILASCVFSRDTPSRHDLSVHTPASSTDLISSQPELNSVEFQPGELYWGSNPFCRLSPSFHVSILAEMKKETHKRTNNKPVNVTSLGTLGLYIEDSMETIKSAAF